MLDDDNNIIYEERPKTARHNLTNSEASNYVNDECNSFNKVLNNSCKVASPENQNSYVKSGITQKDIKSKKTIKVQPKISQANVTNYSSNQTENSKADKDKWVYKNAKTSFYDNKSTKSP